MICIIFSSKNLNQTFLKTCSERKMLSQGGDLEGEENGDLPPYSQSTPARKLYSEVVKLSPELTLEERVMKVERYIESFEVERANFTKNKQILDIGSPENPTTLRGDNPTPELIAIGSTLHLWDYGVLKNNSINSERWKYPFEYHKAIGQFFWSQANVIIDKVQQLPEQEYWNGSRFPANIVFPSPTAREVGVSCLKSYCESQGITNLPLHYSLTKTPVLKKQVKGISLILKELKKEGTIKWYSQNNFMAAKNAEGLAPIFSFQTPTMHKPTSFSSCPSNEFFFSGNIIPMNDKAYTSDKFNLLKGIIRSFIENLYVPKHTVNNMQVNITNDYSQLDIIKEKPKIKKPAQQKHIFKSNDEVLSPSRVQSTPLKNSSFENQTYSRYTSPPPQTLYYFIQQSLAVLQSPNLDPVYYTPNMQNLSIAPSSPGGISEIYSPNSPPPGLKEIEFYEKTPTYQNL